MRRLLPYAGLALLASLLYRPWAPPPLSILDFSEFLPLLQNSSSFWERWAALVHYFRDHGRSTLITYGFIAGNFSLFGANPLGWELARFTVMLTNSLVALALLRRLGFSEAVSFFAAALFVTATGAVGSWLRLTGEMFVMLALLCAGYIGLGYQNRERWGPHAAIFALLMGGAVLAKETSVVLVPLMLGLALVRLENGSVHLTGLTRRNVWLVALTVCVLIPLALMVLANASAGASGYVASYGTGGWSVSRGLVWLAYFGVPIWSLDTRLDVITAYVFSVTVILGWWLRFRRSDNRTRPTLELVFLVLFPLAGAAVYIPWPRVEPFYFYPFFVGPLLLFTVAIDELRRAGPRLSPWAPAMGGTLLLISTLQAYNGARQLHAMHRLNAAIAERMSALPSSDTLFVLVTWSAPQAWQGTGPTLRRYALAMGATAPLPPVVDLPCQSVTTIPDRVAHSANLLSYHQGCGPLKAAQVTLTEGYHSIHLLGMKIAKRQISADFLLDETTPGVTSGDKIP